MSSSNCCFLTCIQISQEGDQVVWYSHLFQNFPQFIVIHTVKGFGIVNKAEVFLHSLLDEKNQGYFCSPLLVNTVLKVLANAIRQEKKKGIHVGKEEVGLFIQDNMRGTSLVVQWLRILLPMQGIQV